jgi:hypothetical protein
LEFVLPLPAGVADCSAVEAVLKFDPPARIVSANPSPGLFTEAIWFAAAVEALASVKATA